MYGEPIDGSSQVLVGVFIISLMDTNKVIRDIWEQAGIYFAYVRFVSFLFSLDTAQNRTQWGVYVIYAF